MPDDTSEDPQVVMRSPSPEETHRTPVQEFRVMSEARAKLPDLPIPDELNDTIDSDSNLVAHARRELLLAGMFDDDADYGPDFAEGLVGVVNRFANMGHSGFSAALATDILSRLFRYETLTPITSSPAEWIDQSSARGRPMWQNRRNPSIFSEDGGQTWYDLNSVCGAVHPYANGSTCQMWEGHERYGIKHRVSSLTPDESEWEEEMADA